MASPVVGTELLGRELELARVAALLAGAREGNGGALMLSGEPGSGKTSLLQAARDQAVDFTVVSCHGVEWEAELPFSGLHELLAPLLTDRDALPEPQREALEGALGLAPVASPQMLNVYAGALTLLVEATRHRPVLVVVDDLQWLDSPTLQALSFMARRLTDDALAFVIATRPGTVLEGLDRAPVELGALDRAAVAALARRSLGRELPEAAVTDLTAASAGNPLAVVESARHFGDELWLRGSPLDQPLPVGALIERGFSDRLAALPPDARDALEVVAASVIDDATPLAAALRELGIADAALEDAERSGVVLLDGGRVQFAHPLLRALVHRQADRGRLRRAHAALAEVVPAESGLRAWHAASAATASDDAIATELDDAADAFVLRGGNLAAAQALARAAALTVDADQRAERLIKAGRNAHFAGRGTWAAELYRQAEQIASTPRILLLAQYETLAQETHLHPSGESAARHLALAERAAPVDPFVAAQALASAAIDAMLDGQAELAHVAARRLQTVPEIEGMDPSNRAVVERAITMYRLMGGGEAARQEADALVDAANAMLIDHTEHAITAECLMWVEAFDLAGHMCDVMVDHARATGDAFTLGESLGIQGYLFARLGDWDAAMAAFDESIRIAEVLGYSFHVLVMQALGSFVLAARGESSFSDEAPGLLQSCRECGTSVMLTYLRTSLGLVELGAGRPAEAIPHLEAARQWMLDAEQVDPGILSWGSDLVEAYALAGRLDTARERLEEFRAVAVGSQRPWMLARLARLDAQLAGDDDYERLFLDALDRFNRTDAPFDQARAQLAFGQRLRRDRRRVDARVQLEAARAVFERLGARPWIEQVQRELVASGATVRRGEHADRDALTPQELQIAQLVAGGASNKEAAGAMFLSPKTIETHLSRVYRKLGVTSRTQLSVLMRDQAPPDEDAPAVD
jgi:ATP/maltotriose-dependent transcriptional regulator MalT